MADNKNGNSSNPFIPPYPLNKNAYTILQPISNGATAIVYKALCIPSNIHVAIKIIDLGVTEKKLDIVPLITGNITLPDHPNILKAHCYFVVKVDNQLWIVMPYIDGGSLQSMIASALPGGFSPNIIATILLRILTALATMHHMGLSHKGVKPGNILVNGNGDVWLSDFGVSTWNYDKELLCDVSSTLCSTFPVITPPYWVPPEAVGSESGYGTKADIYSFGITALELLKGRPPISQFPESKYMLRKMYKRFHFSDHYEKGKHVRKKKSCPDELKHLINVCLARNPTRRPESVVLLTHPLFKEKSKGLPYVAKTLMPGLPRLVDRYKAVTVMPLCWAIIDESNSSKGKNLKQRTIIGWKYNFERLELDPLFRADSLLMEPRELTKSVSLGDVKSYVDIEKKMATLLSLKEKLEEQTKELAETLARIQKGQKKTRTSGEQAEVEGENKHAMVEEVHRQEGGGAQPSGRR